MKEYNHVQYIDLMNNGVLEEVVVLKDEQNGDKHFIKTAGLDEIDLDRLRGILGKRDANKYQLWDLMSNTLLNNGMNALEYFDQLASTRTANGQIIRTRRTSTRVVQVSAEQVVQAPQNGARRPGRPAKTDA